MSPEKALEISSQYGIEGTLEEIREIKTGHINTTYLMRFGSGDGVGRYILQSINKYVFKNPERIMENLEAVTSHIHAKAVQNAWDVDRCTLSFLKAADGRNYHIDSEDVFWRVYKYIDNSTTYDFIDDTDLLYKVGCAFGKFQRLLSDFPMHALHETIPDFHNTKKRLAAFFEAVETDACGRAKDVKEDIAFFRERAGDASRLVDLLESKDLPLRVTHNDTKYNNILIDDRTGEAICVIDLDTVMPGLAAYDFGDAIRFAASSAAEDETDLSKVYIDMDFYEAFTKGFIGAANGFFTDCEIENMAWGARIITLELASRFLMDHINGDKYFRIHHEGHNLERARNQMKLVKDMEAKFDDMTRMVRKYH